MTSEVSWDALYADMQEIILHVLFENGAIAPETLEGYIRDDVDRSAAKITDLLKKTRQAYVDVVSD